MELVRPPGPPPVTPHPLSLLRHARAMGSDPTEIVQRRFEQYGDLYWLRFLKRDVYVTRHPDYAREVLIQQADRFTKPRDGMVARQLHTLLGEGLLNSDGEHWRKQRRLIQPAFRRERLEAYAAWIHGFAEAFAAGLRDGEPIDVSQAMMELTLRIVSRTLFDHEVQRDVDRVRRATTAFRRAFGADALLPAFLPTPGRRAVTRALHDMHTLIDELVARRRGAPEARVDLLSALLAAVDSEGDGSGMTQRQLRDELLTLLLAGHETTSHALTWAFHLLADRPEVEARVREEAERVLGGGSFDPRAVDKLLYTEQVLLEAMRLYPPAYAIARQARAPAQIGGYTIPAQADVVIWIYHLHRDERWFPEPTRFDPDRFAPARRGAIPSVAYIPFGAGSRTCVGKNFALMEAKIILACTLARVSLARRGPSTVARDMAVTLAPKGGLPMRVRALRGWAEGL